MYTNHNNSQIIYSILQTTSLPSSHLLNIIYLSCAYCYTLYGYLDNATLVNMQVLSIVLYCTLF